MNKQKMITSWYQTFPWTNSWGGFFCSKFGVFFRQVLSWTEHCVPWPETWEHLDQCRWWPGRCKSWELVPKTAKPWFFQTLMETSHENTRWWAMWFIESMLHPLNQCLTHHANLNLLTTIYLRLREAHRLWLCQSHRVGVAQRSNRNQSLRFRCCLRFIHRPDWFLSFEFKPSDITTLCELIHRSRGLRIGWDGWVHQMLEFP